MSRSVHTLAGRVFSTWESVTFSPSGGSSTSPSSLRCGSHHWQLSGRAYFDRNLGQRPLHTLGIKRWWWFRLALPGHELIGYHLIPKDPDAETRSLCLTIDPTGETQTIEQARFVMSDWKRGGILGLPWPRTLALTPPDGVPVQIHLAHLVGRARAC